MQDDFSKDGTYFEIYQKIFQFHKKHAARLDWQAIDNDVAEIYSKYQMDFVRDMLYVISDELRRNYEKSE